LAVIIDASVGGSASNSFTTLAEANTYMEARLNSSSWDDATDDSCNRALVEATREISSLPGWRGVRVTDTQSLSWPRDYAIDPDSANDFYYESTEIPQRVKDATMELAFQFLVAGTTDIASLDSNIGIIEKTVDVITTRYAEPYQRAQGLRRYPRVWRLISALMEVSGSQINIVRG
jgi:hypothetical protein